jgi:uncharacterized protein YktA (UPF0223 family)
MNYDHMNKKVKFEGYGIKSVMQFINDVQMVDSGKIDIKQLLNTRPSFKMCRVSTAVIEAAHQSLARQNKLVTVKRYE